MKRFEAWVLKKKAEVEKMFAPIVIDESLLKERTYELRNGRVLQIQKGSVLDVEDIIDIQKACYGGESPWGRLVVYNELQNKYSFFLLAMDYGEPVAFIGISLRKGQMHITNLATKPTHQKQGIASFFIETVAAIGVELDRQIISLEVRTSNKDAIRLYRQLGFEEIYVKKNYYRDNNEDALEMHYKISKEWNEQRED